MGRILKGADFDEKVAKADKPTLVDFFARWCGPCQILEPTIDKLATELKGKANIFKVDIDNSPDLANKFGVMSVPTIFIFKDGKVINQFNGVITKDQLIKALKSE